MELPRRQTPKSNQISKSVGSSLKSVFSTPKSSSLTLKLADSISTGGFTSKTIGSNSGASKDVQMNQNKVEHEVNFFYTGLPCTCKNCGITFMSYYEYYCHLVYSLTHTPSVPVDLELKLATNGHPDVDLELRLSPLTNQKK